MKCDYRETVSDVMTEQFLPRPGHQWAHGLGSLTRNQAHGSPGNLLDLYAAADIPETEMFNTDRNSLVCQVRVFVGRTFSGKTLVSSETGTWLAEHFTETLGDVKRLVDEIFVSGINHVFYHGTCYSPDDAAWPGWLFYAATEMNPRNADLARRAGAERLHRPLPVGSASWPAGQRHPAVLADPRLLARPQGARAAAHRARHRAWLAEQPIGQTAAVTVEPGYAFDYLSDRQLQDHIARSASDSRIFTCGVTIERLSCRRALHMPPDTLEQLHGAGRAGGNHHLPGPIAARRAWAWRSGNTASAAREAVADLQFHDDWNQGPRGPRWQRPVSRGQTWNRALELAGIPREPLADQGELVFVLAGKSAAEHRYLI